MNMRTLTLGLLAVLLVATWPEWSHAQGWGYLPSGAIALAFASIIVLFLTRPI